MSEDITHNEEDDIKPEENQDNLSEESTTPHILPVENTGESTPSHILPVENTGKITENSDAKINEEKTEEPEPADSEPPLEKEEEKPFALQNISGESNYQVSLINENLLRIRVSTVKSVSIDCSVKDVASPGGDASESQSNKIQIHPKPDSKPQEVEIIISIDPESGNIVVEKKKIIS
ncbi:MAG TPA: hypothetical protein VIL99_13620 [Ignavibacteria bacterium]